jgi:hypothetical protein
MDMRDIESQVRDWKSGDNTLKLDMRSKDEWSVTFTCKGSDIYDKDDFIVMQKPDESYLSLHKDSISKIEKDRGGAARVFFNSGPQTFLEVQPTLRSRTR